MAYLTLFFVVFAVSFHLPVNVNGQADIRDHFFVVPKLDITGALTKEKKELTASAAYDCQSQYSCNGCHQIRVCSTCPGGKFQQVSLVNCTGLTPYCKDDSGTCTAFIPENCAPLSENFMCMRESGSYPDATNCSRYNVCKNYTAYSFSCYSGTVYNSRTGECERTDCYKFNCANKNGLKVVYGNNRNVYAYCVHGLLWFIDRCPAGYELNEATQNCEPVCKMEGFLADYDNASNYYVCAKKPGQSTLSAQRRFCSNGTQFDPVFVHCISP